MKDLDEISRIIEEARELLKKISDGHMGAEATHARVRNLLSIAEQELKFHELDKADTASKRLIDIVRTLGATAEILKDAATKAEQAAIAQEKLTKTMVSWTKRMAVATVIVALATIGYTVTSFLQWDILSKQLALSRVDQRAWVGISNIFLQPMQAGQPLKVTVVAVDTGRTFAFDVENKGVITISVEPFNIDEFIKTPQMPKFVHNYSRGVIFPGPGVLLPFATSSNLTEEEINSIKAQKLYPYVFGDITYRDIFGKSHLTQFCGMYDSASSMFTMCSQHNSAN